MAKLPRLGKVTHQLEGEVNLSQYYGEADDFRTFLFEITIDRDKIIDRMFPKAGRSRAGKATALHGAVVVKARRKVGP